MDYNLEPIERETVITLNDQDDFAMIYTAQTKVIRQIRNLMAENNCTAIVFYDKGDCMKVSLPKKYIKISKPRQLNLTEEKRKQLAERLSKGRKNKNNKGE